MVITKLQSGLYSINGEELSFVQAVTKYPREMQDFMDGALKTEDEMIKKTANTELSRAKREHRITKALEYIEANGIELPEFDKTLEDFMPDAIERVKAGKGQRT